MAHLPSNNLSKILKIQNFLHVSTVSYNADSYINIHKRNRIRNTISKNCVVISKTSANRIYCHRKNPERPAHDFENNALLTPENVNRSPFWRPLIAKQTFFFQVPSMECHIDMIFENLGQFSENFNKMFKTNYKKNLGELLKNLTKFSQKF